MQILWVLFILINLAEGLEKFRNDPCIVIWDITLSHSASGDGSERSRYSSSEHGSITKPYLEIGPGETSSSFSWFPQTPRSFVTGMNNRYLRIYDLRDTTRPRLTTQQPRTVSGVCVDSLSTNRLASFGETQVAVWDTRMFDRPILTLQENKPVSKISWCPTRAGMLSVMCKDSSVFKLYDIKHSVMGSDDIEPVIVDRNVQPFVGTALSSYAWHPRHENRLLALSVNGAIKDTVIFERIPLVWSPQFRLTWANGRRTMTCIEEGNLNVLDISARMKHRALQGYGMQCDDVQVNATVVADEPHLQGLWKWISLVRKDLFQKKLSLGRLPSIFNMGVKQVLRYYGDASIPMNSDLIYANWQCVDDVSFNMKHQYRSQERAAALALCGWVSEASQEFNQHLDWLVEKGEVEKAAAIAVFFLKMKKALEILSFNGMNTTNGNASLNAVAMALAGYSEDRNASLWRRTCSTQRYQLSNPYLRAIFAFLACDNDYYSDVLEEDGMAVEDRVAFALTYLPDAKLKQYIERLTEELVRTGDLDGMLLTGMSSEGIDLMEKYVDLTSDVQTAAITAVFTGMIPAAKDERVNSWICNYKMLLDQWCLWHERVMFDIVTQACVPDLVVPPQVFISCNFCGKSVTNTRGFRMPERNYLPPFSRAPQQQRVKISCCPSCRKALPRCAICLCTLGTASAFGVSGEHSPLQGGQEKLTPFVDWFSWCQTCRHGGHAGHITAWFRDHTDCPVTGCSCKCLMIDSPIKPLGS
ncbi:GATOR complex protein MIOS-like isoform X2 [Pomacea canaliculata]|uniref:GATOR complex protein MIOS-like isoform X2 n=1 Tax=Pomacea canaliculata TaxID=400727 RepID=UPI000D7339F7|nr:GATOR complex protein MIOS-like isoform X2 [Pomacea canaliculata]